MSIWKAYYEEYQRRQNLLDEAKQYRLIHAFPNPKESRLKKSLYRFQAKDIANNKVLGYGSK